jgi:hypothetical protein
VRWGGGSAEYNDDRSLNGPVTLYGETSDTPAAHNGKDVTSLMSTFEGLNTAVGGATACAFPCVVKGFGDYTETDGTTGIVVRCDDAPAPCNAFQRMTNTRLTGGLTEGLRPEWAAWTLTMSHLWWYSLPPR